MIKKIPNLASAIWKWFFFLFFVCMFVIETVSSMIPPLPPRLLGVVFPACAASEHLPLMDTCHCLLWVTVGVVSYLLSKWRLC